MSLFVLLSLLSITHSATMPSISLNNAADKDLKMPVVGLGTIGYFPYGGAPENWNNNVAHNASLLWLSVGATRFDSAYDYKSKQGVADAILEYTNDYTTIPRSDIFITQKCGGNGNALGYDNVMAQVTGLLQMYKTSYFDLLLIHWPSLNTGTSQSTDPVCQNGRREYNASLCRQHTWKALEDMYTNGTVKAIGVSNYEIKHLNDIIAMNSLLPAVNQFEYHGYWHELELVKFCQNNKITVNSYAPLGTPDVEANGFHDWPYVLTENPVAIKIGQTYKKSAAQVWLRWAWQQQIVLNPRTLNIDHMKENIDIFDFQLSDDNMQQLFDANSTAPKYPNDKVCPDPNTYK